RCLRPARHLAVCLQMSSARTVVARSASSRTSLPLLRGTVPGSSVLHRDRLSSTGCDLEVDTSFTGRRVVAVLNLLVAMRGNLQTGGARGSGASSAVDRHSTR